MAERLNNTIETQINDGNTIVSQIVDNNQPLQTVIQDVPQVQTVLQNGINVSSQINAPFVEVTSVNGKTGDVITEPVVGVFEPNHYYLENTMITHNNNLYYAKETFTSGSSFNTNDWYSVEGSQITVDSALSSTSENPVQNKVITSALNNKVNSSDLAEVATSGSFTDLINVPVFPTVNNATLTIQKNGTTVNTFTANSSTNKTANITVPTKTSEIENDSNFLTTEDLFTTKTGTNISISDAAATPLSSFQLKGETSQNGTPTPSAPVAVQTVTGENVVKICGKNMNEWENVAWSSSTTTASWCFQDGTTGAYGSNITSKTDYKITLPAGTYTAKVYDLSSNIVNIQACADGSPNEVVVTVPSNINSSNLSSTITLTETTTVVVRYRVTDPSLGIGNTKVQIEKGSATAYEPYQGQSYEINLGKNLFDAANADVKTGYILNNSGVEVSDNTGGYTRNYSAVRPNTTYTISGMAGAGTRRIYFYDGGKTFLSRTSGYSGAQKITFTTPANCYFVNVQIYTNTDTSSAMASWQLELGSTATSYAAYFAPIELCKIGDYQDYIYKSDGKWYVRKEVGKITFTSTTAWTKHGTTGGNVFMLDNTGFIGYGYGGNAAPALMDTARVIALGSMPDSANGVFGVNNGSQLRVFRGAYDASYTAGTFKAEMVGHYIYGALATPTDTEITNEALIAQLEAILSQGKTYAGTNNITTVISAGNEQGELEITYPKFFSKIATTSSLGSIRVGDGLNITPEGILSTQLGFTTESTSGNTKIIKLQDGTTTSYPITTKEAVLGLKTYNASWLYDLIYDSTAFTSQQVSELREAILNKDDILIYDGDPTSPTGQTSYYRPVLASTSNTLEFLGLLNISFITAGPNMYSYSFMTTDQGETWSLNANSGGAFLATKYKAGSSFSYTAPSSQCCIMLPGILTTGGTEGKFSINLGAPIIASSVTVNTFKGNIRTSNGGYWINTGYVTGGQNYLNTSGVTVTAGVDGNQVNFILARTSAQSGVTNNTPMTMELNALSLTFS